MSFLCESLKIGSNDRDIVDISFKISNSFALIGESGSGKSLTLKALLGLLPTNLKYSLQYSSNFRLKRGDTLAFVPQNPFTALSPLTKIRKQFFKPLDIVIKNLELVGLDKEFLDRFPPELSGGQLQRVIIAMALDRETRLLLLDEPTTALDEKSKSGVLKLLKELQQIYNFLILFVTHDTDSAKELCSEVGIIKNGEIIESGLISEIFKNPQNSYTKSLLESNFKNRGFRE